MVHRRMGVRNENNTRPQNRSTQINEVGNRSDLAMAAPSGEPETEKRKERKEGGASTEIPTWLEDVGRRTSSIDWAASVRFARSRAGILGKLTPTQQKQDLTRLRREQGMPATGDFTSLPTLSLPLSQISSFSRLLRSPGLLGCLSE